MTLIKDVIRVRKEYKEERTANIKKPELTLKEINSLNGHGNRFPPKRKS